MSETTTDAAVVIQAAACVLLDAALNLIQADPHQWSTRPCGTCRSVTAIIGRRFGCDLYRQQEAKAS